jgi:hypothetical protein
LELIEGVELLLLLLLLFFRGKVTELNKSLNPDGIVERNCIAHVENYHSNSFCLWFIMISDMNITVEGRGKPNRLYNYWVVYI